MAEKKEFTLTGSENRPFAVDLTLTDKPHQPVVVFAHGFKGYKDWGCWNLMADRFANNGLNFLKFNFSHNGGTVENPIDFTDLEAFGDNRYSWELADLNTVLDYVQQNAGAWNTIPEIYLIGHSRGGGIAVLAAVHPAMKKLVTWAAVSDFEARLPDEQGLEEWKREGVRYIMNGRTKQNMPMYYSFVEDLQSHREQLNILKSAGKLDKPVLIVHGENDEAVPVSDAYALAEATNGECLIIAETGHTFDAKHPWDQPELPEKSQTLADETINFLKRET